MRLLGLIPARAGSKSIARKNLRHLAGKPLLVHTVEAALGAGVLDRLVVSTEDEEIANVARDTGAEVPFRRPSQLATDDSPSQAAIRHAIEWLASEGYRPDALMVLQATSPLRESEDIRAAASRLASGSAALVGVTPVTQHPLWMKRVELETGRLSPYVEGAVPARRQDLPPLYRINGAMYAARLAYWDAHNGFYGPNTEAFIMPEERSLDLDSLLDWRIAECLMREELET